MKIGLVTGGARGLGKGFVNYFLKEGFKVIVGVRNTIKAKEVFGDNKNVFILELDVSSDESLKKAFKEVKNNFDHIDDLINNAALNKDTATNNHKELVFTLLE